MTDPVITIGGRALVPPQVAALRASLEHFLGLTKALGASSSVDPDRVAEIIAILSAPPRASGMPIDDERDAQTKVMTGMHAQRVNRILQLAGIVPEQATQKQKDLAATYAGLAIPVDEAAIRLQQGEQ